MRLLEENYETKSELDGGDLREACGELLEMAALVECITEDAELDKPQRLMFVDTLSRVLDRLGNAETNASES